MIQTPVANCFLDDLKRARARRSRLLDQTGSEILIESGVHLFVAKIRLMQWGREVTCAVPTGTEILKGIREQQPKIRFGSVKKVQKFTENVA